MTVRIYGADGKKTKGCVGITYFGYSLSISTIADPPELIILDVVKKDVTEELTGTYSLNATSRGIQEAMRAIDAKINDERSGNSDSSKTPPPPFFRSTSKDAGDWS